MHELIRTKVAPPIWMGSQIHRDGLLIRLDEALSRRMTVIHAPAGYGKTSLLSQWRTRVAQRDALVAWLTLEREDADLRRLPQYVLLAIEEAARSIGTDHEPDTISPDLPARAALSAIISRLAHETRPVVLIFDDFHRVQGPEVNRFVQSLIRLAPENCHFVIASRDYPWLGQSVLAAEEHLLELAAEDMRFSGDEAAALIARGQVGDLPQDLLEQLVARSEGWPIALQLTSLSLKRGIEGTKLLEKFTGPASGLARYLSEQVLIALPDETRDLVSATALLDPVTGDALNALCDRSDGWAMLERLEQQGVFLTPVSDAREAWRYHQLFAEYLRERMAREAPDRLRELHGRAARHYARRRQITQAIDHAIEAADEVLIATILEDAGGWRLIPQGHLALVKAALGHLGTDMVERRPKLLLAHIYLRIKQGDLPTARTLFDTLQAKEPSPSDLTTEIRVVGDTLVDYENLPVTFDDLLAREALLRTLPSDDHLVLANCTETLAANYLEGGWLERAMEPTLAARRHYQALGSLYSEIFTHFLESRIRRAQGRIDEAVAIIGRLRPLIESEYGPRSDLAANCAAFEAELHYEQNRYDDAAALLDWALPHMEQSDGWVDVYAAAYFAAARLAMARGEAENAQTIVERARRLAQTRGFLQLELLADLCHIELLLAHPDTLAEARTRSVAFDVDTLAHEMRLPSPRWRPVALAATLCAVQLSLLDQDDPQKALDLLAPLEQWANHHGAARALVDCAILKAAALRRLDQPDQARAAFDEAIGLATFQSLYRPFIDLYRFSRDFLPSMPEADGASGNRFRDQFLATIIRATEARAQVHEPQGLLNAAEAEILGHLSKGLANKEIARLIGMSPDTVKYRLKSIFRKIGVDKRRDAVRIAHEQGLLPDQPCPAVET